MMSKWSVQKFVMFALTPLLTLPQSFSHLGNLTFCCNLDSQSAFPSTWPLTREVQEMSLLHSQIETGKCLNSNLVMKAQI